MPYIVLVDDNFRYQDIEARWKLGEYDSADHALAACRDLVDRYLRDAMAGGTQPEGLLESYRMFGDDPFIQCVGVPHVAFSAWDYAEAQIDLVCIGVRCSVNADPAGHVAQASPEREDASMTSSASTPISPGLPPPPAITPAPPSAPPASPGPAPAPSSAASGDDDWTKVLGWAETAGTENLKTRHANLDSLRKEAATTLTVILAGVGGGLTYAGKLLEPGPAGAVSFGAAFFCIYLIGLGAAVVLRCLLVREVPATYQLPLNLAQQGYTFNDLREAELANIQDRIEQFVGINGGIAKSLRAIRVLTVLSPVVFAIFASLYQVKVSPTSTPAMKLTCRTLSQSAPTDPQLACNTTP